ncbi:hypothetical protein R50073_30480 [Maricurvus nonylphenolicus]|uniref:sulfur carrier protein ThiS n=1 Tax=Maricurvus nonylphenolicus TaxID=1008307 RepID=UPI0036F2EE11
MPDSTIQISLNGNSFELSANSSLADAVAKADFCCDKIAAAVNGEFVPRSQYDEHILFGDDKVDIVTPVGGG